MTHLQSYREGGHIRIFCSGGAIEPGQITDNPEKVDCLTCLQKAVLQLLAILFK